MHLTLYYCFYNVPNTKISAVPKAKHISKHSVSHMLSILNE